MNNTIQQNTTSYLHYRHNETERNQPSSPTLLTNPSHQPSSPTLLTTQSIYLSYLSGLPIFSVRIRASRYDGVPILLNKIRDNWPGVRGR